MKKILIITDTFPPYKHIGRFRIQQFSKYLPDYGWEPIILTPTSSYLWEKDDTLLKEIPNNLKVFRPFMPPSLPAIIRNICGSIKKKKKINHQITAFEKSPGKSIRKSVGSWLKKIATSTINHYQSFISKHILIPGTQILWVPFAVSKAQKIIKKYNIDIIFSSVPVYSNHIVAYFLKLLTRKPWIADYRDLWTNDITRRKRFTKFRGKIERSMEKKLLQYMDSIIFVSAQKIPVIKSEFPDINFKNTVVIPNGFDQDIISYKKEVYQKGKKINILYTGRITPHRHHNQFLPSVGKLLSEYPEIKNNLRVEFIGQILKEEQVGFDEIIKYYSMQNNIVVSGWMEHKKILMKQRKTDILLLIVDDVKFANAILPGKVFEYIISGRPILTLAPKGDTKNIIEETNTGIVVPPKKEEKIMQAIISYYRQWESDTLYINPNRNNINKYNRKNLTRKLAHLFNSFN
ncbi:MAG: glycosyltransferase [Bacteroidales bacterium]|nr:glycosyltransferase [Bacteroidales bacterium]